MDLLLSVDSDLLAGERQRVRVLSVDFPFAFLSMDGVVCKHVRLHSHSVLAKTQSITAENEASVRKSLAMRGELSSYHIIGADEGVVNSDELNVIPLERHSGNQAAEAAKAIDPDSYLAIAWRLGGSAGTYTTTSTVYTMSQIPSP